MRHRILLVDDEQTVLFALSDYFRARGYEVDCARTLEQSELLLGSRAYSLLIADLQLTAGAENEGLHIVDQVHRISPATRIMVLTAYSSPEIEHAAWARGADVFLQKPKPLHVLALIAARLLGAYS